MNLLKNQRTRSLLVVSFALMTLMIASITGSQIYVSNPNAPKLNEQDKVQEQTTIVGDYETVYKGENFGIRAAKLLIEDDKQGYYYGPDPEKRQELRRKGVDEKSIPTEIDVVFKEIENYPNEWGRNIYFVQRDQVLMLKIARLEGNGVDRYESIDLKVNGKYPFRTVYTDFSVEDGIHWDYNNEQLAFTYQKYIGATGHNPNYIQSIYEYKDGELTELADKYGYDSAFAPNYLPGGLFYIAKKDGELRIVLDDKEYLVGRYKRIDNAYCCDAQLSRVLSDGNLVDFYGYTDDGIYHVQAGSFQ